MKNLFCSAGGDFGSGFLEKSGRFVFQSLDKIQTGINEQGYFSFKRRAELQSASKEAVEELQSTLKDLVFEDANAALKEKESPFRKALKERGFGDLLNYFDKRIEKGRDGLDTAANGNYYKSTTLAVLYLQFDGGFRDAQLDGVFGGDSFELLKERVGKGSAEERRMLEDDFSEEERQQARKAILEEESGGVKLENVFETPEKLGNLRDYNLRTLEGHIRFLTSTYGTKEMTGDLMSYLEEYNEFLKDQNCPQLKPVDVEVIQLYVGQREGLLRVMQRVVDGDLIEEGVLGWAKDIGEALAGAVTGDNRSDLEKALEREDIRNSQFAPELQALADKFKEDYQAKIKKINALALQIEAQRGVILNEYGEGLGEQIIKAFFITAASFIIGGKFDFLIGAIRTPLIDGMHDLMNVNMVDKVMHDKKTIHEVLDDRCRERGLSYTEIVRKNFQDGERLRLQFMFNYNDTNEKIIRKQREHLDWTVRSHGLILGDRGEIAAEQGDEDIASAFQGFLWWERWLGEDSERYDQAQEQLKILKDLSFWDDPKLASKLEKAKPGDTFAIGKHIEYGTTEKMSIRKTERGWDVLKTYESTTWGPGDVTNVGDGEYLITEKVGIYTVARKGPGIKKIDGYVPIYGKYFDFIDQIHDPEARIEAFEKKRKALKELVRIAEGEMADDYDNLDINGDIPAVRARIDAEMQKATGEKKEKEKFEGKWIDLGKHFGRIWKFRYLGMYNKIKARIKKNADGSASWELGEEKQKGDGSLEIVPIPDDQENKGKFKKYYDYLEKRGNFINYLDDEPRARLKSVRELKRMSEVFDGYMDMTTTYDRLEEVLEAKTNSEKEKIITRMILEEYRGAEFDGKKNAAVLLADFPVPDKNSKLRRTISSYFDAPKGSREAILEELMDSDEFEDWYLSICATINNADCELHTARVQKFEKMALYPDAAGATHYRFYFTNQMARAFGDIFKSNGSADDSSGGGIRKGPGGGAPAK